MKQTHLDKLEALFETLQVTAPLYSSFTSIAQKQFLETTIGAALFYMPKSKRNWTGYILEGGTEVGT